MAESKSYIPHLYVEGVEVPINGFVLSAPEGRIGVSLVFDIADQTVDVERGDEVDFDIAVGAQTASLIVNGKATTRNKSYGSSDSSPRPSDSFNCAAADTLGEGKLAIAPRTPLILYDPALTTLADNETDTQVNDEDGERIYAEARSIASLDVLQAMNAAYVEGAGFASVITNVFNYSLPRVDFPLTASYHNAVKSLFITQYKPQVFEDDNRIFIVDARGTLPTGFPATARLYTPDDVIRVERIKPEIQPVNALLLTTHETTAQEIPSTLPGGITERTEVDTSTSGSIITDDYQQTVVTRYIAQLHEDESDPSRVTTEVVYKTQTRTSGQDENGVLRELLFDEQVELFDFNFARNLGYNRTVNAYVERPGELPLSENVLTEQSRIAWKSTGKFGEFVKVFETNVVEGLVMIEGEDPDITRTSLVDANRFGPVPEDATVERMPITTKNFYFRETGPDQVEILTQGTDHLYGRPIIPRSQHHTGTIRIQLRGTSTGTTKQTLIRDEAGEAADGAREPITWDAGFLPFEQAFPLAERVLADAKEPPEQLAVTLLKPDLGLHRGSLRRVQVNRTGTTKIGVVTSYNLRGEPDKGGMLKLTMDFILLVTGNA